eukprot:jgi/Bigna1/58289/fgenesh1_pm.72_\
MIESLSPMWQGLLGTLFTWGVTAVSSQMFFLDASLGFAAGVMLAASYWSLLAPAIEMSDDYGSLAFLPASVGFVLGALVVYAGDVFLKFIGADGRSMMLLVAAITIHNFPEGLAVGVGFGAIGKGRGATFAKARNLAVGIGLQNFPEGLAVSLPLRRIGFTKHKAFFWGQASGMVEPIGGLMGAIAVSIVEPILPYALSLAAGAMVYVECSSGCIIGFVVMMTLDVALG